MLNILDTLASRITPGPLSNASCNNSQMKCYGKVHPYQQPHNTKEQHYAKSRNFICTNFVENKVNEQEMVVNNNNNNINILNKNITNDNDNNVITEDECFIIDEQPDPDSIKMFVGQIPRTMDEQQLFDLFKEYGRVYNVNLLKDKTNGMSRGCCFVTYYTRKDALKAQGALHNIKTLVGMHHPIQMKPADSEKRNERKLFVGMLSKKFDEGDVRQLFTGHGVIDECSVLRDANGKSKGCAFVTFASKQAATRAMRKLHQSQTLEGCSAPIVVKFADTAKDKAVKPSPISKEYNLWNLTKDLAQISQQSIEPNIIALAANQLQQLIKEIGSRQKILPDPPVSHTAGTSLDLLNPLLVGNVASAMTGIVDQALKALPLASLNPAFCENLQQHIKTVSSKLTATYPLTEIRTSNNLVPLPNNHAVFQVVSKVAGKQIEGPQDCNLFIYHLPSELTDADLAILFLPFGNMISAKVFMDLQTNLSKCFGFVSYDNAASAQVAIQVMNNCQIGTKKLKVQLKRNSIKN